LGGIIKTLLREFFKNWRKTPSPKVKGKQKNFWRKMAKPPPAYMHYQQSGLGIALRQTLQEMVDEDTVTPEVATKILKQFDASVNESLKTGTRTKASFKV
jgi:hypothetical protein